MWQLVLAQIPVEGGILDMDEHGFLNSSGLIVNFFVHNVELVGVQRMSCGSHCGGVWGRGLLSVP